MNALGLTLKFNEDLKNETLIPYTDYSLESHVLETDRIRASLNLVDAKICIEGKGDRRLTRAFQYLDFLSSQLEAHLSKIGSDNMHPLHRMDNVIGFVNEHVEKSPSTKALLESRKIMLERIPYTL